MNRLRRYSVDDAKYLLADAPASSVGEDYGYISV
jgi:hypothetical protein